MKTTTKTTKNTQKNPQAPRKKRKFPHSDARLKKIRVTWLTAWLTTSRKCAFPRLVADALRAAGTSVREVEEILSVLQLIKLSEMTTEQRRLILLWRDVHVESKMCLEEAVADSPKSAVFLLQAKHGYDARQTMRVEEVSLQEIVESKSKHVQP